MHQRQLQCGVCTGKHTERGACISSFPSVYSVLPPPTSYIGLFIPLVRFMLGLSVMAASVKTTTTTHGGSPASHSKGISIRVLLHSFETAVYGSFQLIQRKVRQQRMASFRPPCRFATTCGLINTDAAAESFFHLAAPIASTSDNVWYGNQVSAALRLCIVCGTLPQWTRLHQPYCCILVRCSPRYAAGDAKTWHVTDSVQSTQQRVAM